MSDVTLNTASGSITLTPANSSGNKILTLPAVSGTVATLGTTLTSGTAVASTSGTSIDFTGIPSWAKRITVMFNGVSTNGSSEILIRLGTSGGIVVAGYSGSSTQFATTTMSSASYTTGFAYKISGATGVYSGNTSIHNLTGNVFSTNGNVGNSLGDYGCITGGSVTLSSTLDRVRITTVNGTDTFDAGSINILYE